MHIGLSEYCCHCEHLKVSVLENQARGSAWEMAEVSNLSQILPARTIWGESNLSTPFSYVKFTKKVACAHRTFFFPK